jgi:phosphate-selective porin OprO/OprP
VASTTLPALASNSSSALKNVFGKTSVRVGQFNQPVGLELLTSSNDITLMERSTLTELVPARQTGIMLHGPIGASKRGSFAVSAFRNADDSGQATEDDSWSVASRWTGLVVDSENGDVVHLGISGAARNNGNDVLAVDLAPEAHLAPDYNVFEFGADSWALIGLEAAAVFGSIHLQAEHMLVLADASGDGDNPNFSAFEVQAGYFLTGERRPYKKSSATFDRVKPRQNFREEGGRGAVELAARYSKLDLSDGLIDGGTLDSISAGVNWYLNPTARVMLNYVHSDGDSPDHSGALQAVQTRFQVSF